MFNLVLVGFCTKVLLKFLLFFFYFLNVFLTIFLTLQLVSRTLSDLQMSIEVRIGSFYQIFYRIFSKFCVNWSYFLKAYFLPINSNGSGGPSPKPTSTTNDLLLISWTMHTAWLQFFFRAGGSTFFNHVKSKRSFNDPQKPRCNVTLYPNDVSKYENAPTKIKQYPPLPRLISLHSEKEN